MHLDQLNQGIVAEVCESARQNSPTLRLCVLLDEVVDRVTTLNNKDRSPVIRVIANAAALDAWRDFDPQGDKTAYAFFACRIKNTITGFYANQKIAMFKKVLDEKAIQGLQHTE